MEDSASGQSLLQELRTVLPIKGVKPDADKFTRAASITPAMENGQFWLLEGAPWSNDYLAELTAFPGGAHDDFVDATVQALTYLRQSREPGILTFYRDLAEAKRTGRRKLPGLGGIRAYEQARFRREAGFCHICGESLFMKKSETDGPGQLCMDCVRKHR